MIIVRKDGAATADNTPTMVTTISNSMIVKPACRRGAAGGRSIRKPQRDLLPVLRIYMNGTPFLPFGTRIRYRVDCAAQPRRDEWQSVSDERNRI